jgi:hypothetical protein
MVTDDRWAEMTDDTFTRLSEGGFDPEEARKRTVAIIDDTKSFAAEVEEKLSQVPARMRPLWPKGMNAGTRAAFQRSMELIQSTAAHAYWERLVNKEFEERLERGGES